MGKLTACLFLMAITFPGSGNAGRHEIVPDRTIWLGESLKLSIYIPNMKKPTTWQVKSFDEKCEGSCARRAYHNVTHYEDNSTLLIANVSWEYSRWFVSDSNMEYGETELDINAKPSIEIQNTSSGYKVMAKCSNPVTRITCYQGQRRLEVTSGKLSYCSDRRMLNNIVTLNFSEFCGNVICWFTIGDIFKEYRLLQSQSPNCCARNFKTEYFFLIVSGALFFAAIAVGFVLSKRLIRKWKLVKAPSGEVAPAINLSPEFVLRFLFYAIILAIQFPAYKACQMSKEMKSPTYEEDGVPFMPICSIANLFQMLSLLLVSLWSIAALIMCFLKWRLEDLKEHDHRQDIPAATILLPDYYVPETLVQIQVLIFLDWICGKGEECPRNECFIAIGFLSVFLVLNMAESFYFSCRLKKKKKRISGPLHQENTTPFIKT